MATRICCARSRPSSSTNIPRPCSSCTLPWSKPTLSACAKPFICCRANWLISPPNRRWCNCGMCASTCMPAIGWPPPSLSASCRTNWTNCGPPCGSSPERKMKLLVAEDDGFYARMLQEILRGDYDVTVVADGNRAWEFLQAEAAPRLALLDWQMPGMDGLQVCRKVRAHPALAGVYLVIATVRQNQGDVLAGFAAGADDYITKPFDIQELQARLRVGRRVVELQSALAGRVAQLQDALSRVKQLHGLLPICSYCKRIRDDRDYWQQVETYMSEHSQATFTHGICPECYEKFFKAELEELRKGR